MTSKKDLEDAFKAGWGCAERQMYESREPDLQPSFEAWLKDFRKTEKERRRHREYAKILRTKATIAEGIRRTKLNLAEADRPPPPYTKD